MKDPATGSAALRIALASGFLLTALPAAFCGAQSADAGAVPIPAPSGEQQPIDLPTALRLAGLHSIDLALVREAENQARAADDAATLRFFPWLSVGAGYAKHTGAGQDFAGDVLDVDRKLYGASASFNAQFDLGEAIFQKLAARQLRNAASYAAEAKGFDTVLAVAAAYFDLVDAAATEDIEREAVRIARDYEQQLGRAADIGMTNRSDALRASVQAQRDALVLREAQAAFQRASAALATLLRLDPVVQLIPNERLVVPALLVPLDLPADALVREALEFRPELKGSAAQIEAADRQLAAARYGPLIPSIGAEALVGRIRGGPGDSLSDYASSHDYIVGMAWRLGPGGLLDFSRTELADSQLRKVRLSDQKLRDTIAREVVDAYAAARAAMDQIALARHGADLAEQSLRLSEQRREYGVYAVLEVIQAQQDLTRARRDYAAALTEYAKAQYTLAHATARIGK